MKISQATRNPDLKFSVKESNSDLLKFATDSSHFQSILEGASDIRKYQRKEFMNQAISVMSFRQNKRL